MLLAENDDAVLIGERDAAEEEKAESLNPSCAGDDLGSVVGRILRAEDLPALDEPVEGAFAGVMVSNVNVPDTCC